MSDQRGVIVYQTISFDSNELMQVDSVFFERTDCGSLYWSSVFGFKLNLLFENDSISYCDLKLNCRCWKIYDLKNASRVLTPVVEKNKNLGFIMPSDTRLVEVKEYQIHETSTRVFKFKVDELESSHRFRYVYFSGEFGFLAFADPLENKYTISKGGDFENRDLRVLGLLVDKVLSDSSFFEYPVFMPPPPVPQGSSLSNQ